MPRPRKVILNRRILFVTCSVEEGLPLPPNPLINAIIQSVLGRAQALYRVRVCHAIFESNHLHMVLVVDNPNDVKDFIGRVKTETAHAVNRLMGRKKRTIWCSGYDSPALLDVDAVIREIVYLYTNPAKDDLEDTIERYPGVNSWKAFRSGRHRKVCPWIHRSDLYALTSTKLSIPEFETKARALKNKAKEKHTFTYYPDAWMEYVGVTDPKERKALNERIVSEVKEVEEGFSTERQKKGKTVMGAGRLMRQPMDTPYEPKRTGKRMWCISSDVGLRIEYIAMVKALIEEASQVYSRWKVGDVAVRYPAGLFAPPVPKLVELVDSSLY